MITKSKKKTVPGFSLADVKKLALLARLKLTEGEMEKLTGELSSIMSFVDQIQKASAKLNENKALLRTVMRSDTDPYPKGVFAKNLLAAAPKREGKYFKVKKILTRS